MKNTYGSALALTIFGESHGPAIGAVLDGMAAGVPVDEAFIAAAEKTYEAKEQEVTTPIMRELERVIMLRVVDEYWMDHIDAMEELKRGIYLRSYGQKDPVVEYRFEGFAMFDEMIAAIREETVRMVLTVPVRVQRPPQREQVMKPDAPNAGAQTPYKNKGEKIGRNDPCPCGSGKKYKNCCGKDE